MKKRVKLNPTVPNTFPKPRRVQVTSPGGRTSCEIKEAPVMRETGGDTILQPRTTVLSLGAWCHPVPWRLQRSLHPPCAAALPRLPGQVWGVLGGAGAACRTQPQLSSPGVWEHSPAWVCRREGGTALPRQGLLCAALGTGSFPPCSEAAAGFAVCDCAFF